MNTTIPPNPLNDTLSSDTLFEKACTLIPGGVSSPVRAFKSVGGRPFFVSQGQGAYLTTVDGKELIDYVGTMGPAIHGHNHPYIRESVTQSLQKGISFWMPHPHEIHMAEKINKLVPSAEKIRFCNSGTEATMIAIRIARGYTQRNKIIKFSGCYHGHVDSLLVKAGSGALCLGCPDSAGVPPGHTQDTVVLPLNDIASLEQAFKLYSHDLAGVIIEPYAGNCGFILPKNGFLQSLRNLCTEHKTVLIFDEVMTGFRLSLGGVQSIENIMPDLTCLGKIIGGGFPVGVVCGKAHIMDCLAPLGSVYQAGTMSGNPIALIAGIASLDLLETTKPYNDLHQKGQTLKNALLEAANKKSIPLQVPQYGSMFSLFFHPSPINSLEDALQTSTHYFKPFFKYCLNHGVFIPPSPYETAFISTAHTPSIIDQTAETFFKAIMQL